MIRMIPTRCAAFSSWVAIAFSLPLFLLPAGTAIAQAPKPAVDPQLPLPKPVPGQTPPIAPNVKPVVVPPAVSLPAAPSRPADVPSRPLTADEAVRIALHNQPNVIVARAGISAAQGRTQQARSGLLPSVILSAGYTNVQTLSTEGNGAAVGTSGSTTGGGSTGGSGSGGTSSSGSTFGGATGGSGTTASGFQAAAVARQLIFDFNHTRDLVRQASQQERAATYNLAQVETDLVLQVKQAFYLFVQNSRLTAINEENIANRRSQLALAQARLTSGLGLPADVVTAETALAEATTNLITARTNETLSRISLALTMGIDPRTPIDAATSSEPPVVTDDVQGLVDTALKQRSDILQAVSLLTAARYGVSAARTTNAPSLAGNIGLLSRGVDFPPESDSFSVGVSVQWDPFDGGFTAGKVKEARANVVSAQAQLTNTQLGAVSDVSQAYMSLRNAEQRVVSGDTEVANAAEGVRIAQGRFSRGLGLFLDIINAQAALVTARSNRASAQYGVHQARAALSRAIGAPIIR